MATEREVVARAQKGDERAFEALVVAIHPRLFRLAHGILRDPVLAEDAAQQAFLDSWRLLPRLRDPERFTAWSYRSLLEAAGEIAAKHPERLSPAPSIVLAPRAPHPFGTGTGTGPDRDLVGAGYLALPFDSRCVIVLRYLLDLKMEEVAQGLAISTGAAASRLERALADVRATAGLGDGAVTDERLAADVAAWLHETDVTPPDSRMSAGRVMAGVEGAEQLGRWWPPARSVPRARPVPALGAPRAPELPPPVDGSAGPGTSRVRSQLTPPRVLLAALLLMLAAGSLLLLPSLLSDPSGSTAMASPSPTPNVVASAAPTSSIAPAPTPTPVPTPSSAAEAEFVSTRTLMQLEPGADPASLGPGASRTAIFVDRAAGVVYEVAAEGEATVVASGGSSAGAGPMAAPVLAARGGKDIVIFDAAGQAWRPLAGAGPGLLEPLVRIDPATQALSSTTKGAREYDLYLAEPASGDIVHYSMRAPGDELVEQDDRTVRAGRPRVLDLYVDQHRYVLTEAGIERYVKGELDETFELAPMPVGEPDFRFVDGIGRAGKGQLWLYDAAGRQVVAFDKGTGAYLGSWAPGEGEPAMTDVRGLSVGGDGSGGVATVTWLTPDGLMQSELPDVSAAQEASENDDA